VPLEGLSRYQPLLGVVHTTSLLVVMIKDLNLRRRETLKKQSRGLFLGERSERFIREEENFASQNFIKSSLRNHICTTELIQFQSHDHP